MLRLLLRLVVDFTINPVIHTPRNVAEGGSIMAQVFRRKNSRHCYARFRVAGDAA